MRMTGNTMLLTGGGSGIGRAVADAFHKLGNEIILVVRGDDELDKLKAENPDFHFLSADVSEPASVKKLADEAKALYPSLNAVFHFAGIMIDQNLLSGKDFTDIETRTISTNLLGTIRVTEELLPLLITQERATVMTVSSGLAFVPTASTPTYCATKAAIHSYSQTLRFQLRKTNVQVIELIPPYVATKLQGERQANDPEAMQVGDFVSEVMEILHASPSVTEVLVKRVLPLRLANSHGPEAYDAFFWDYNNKQAAKASQ